MPYKNKDDAAAQKRRWRKANPDKVRESNKRWYERNGYTKVDKRTKEQIDVKNKKARESRIKFLHEQLGDCCCNCGSKLNLEFDHINPALKLTRTPPQSMGVRSIQKELGNLQVLCKNCHSIKTRAQKAAAWHLFCQLTEEEQTELTHQFEHHTIKPSN